jgi:hypothetical protein
MVDGHAAHTGHSPQTAVAAHSSHRLRVHCVCDRSTASNKLIVWRLIAVVPLQGLWISRALLLPAVAGIGTATAMSSSDTAVDIVLNAM